MTQYVPGDPYYPFEKPGPLGEKEPKPEEPTKPKSKGLLSRLTMGFFGVVMLAGVSYGASHEENWERTRLTEQPDTGEITENLKDGGYTEACGNPKDLTHHTGFKTSTGFLFFETGRKEKPYVDLNEEGKIKQNPWVFLERSTGIVYVNLDYKGEDDLYDFKQHRSRTRSL